MADDLLDAARAALFLDRPCPACGAAFSHPCRTTSGNYRREVHRERMTAVPRQWAQADLFATMGP